MQIPHSIICSIFGLCNIYTLSFFFFKSFSVKFRWNVLNFEKWESNPICMKKKVIQSDKHTLYGKHLFPMLLLAIRLLHKNGIYKHFFLRDLLTFLNFYKCICIFMSDIYILYTFYIYMSSDSLYLYIVST